MGVIFVNGLTGKENREILTGMPRYPDGLALDVTGACGSCDQYSLLLPLLEQSWIDSYSGTVRR
jgi:hypothetical protein